MKEKKKFKDTDVGKFISNKFPNIIDAVDDIFPPAKLLTALLKKEEVSPEDKVKLDELMLSYEKENTARIISEDVNVTERWKADSMSDSRLSKNSRPITLLSLLGFVYIIVVIDAIQVIKFDIKESYIEMLQMLLTTVVIAYFGGRSAEKWKSMSKK